MKLLPREEAILRPDDVVFRYAWKTRAVLGAVLVTLGAGAALAAMFERLSLMWGALLGFIGAVGWLTFARPALRSLGRHGWLMAAGPERLLVRLRSFLASGGTQGDAAMLELGAGEVEAVRVTSVVLVLDAKGAVPGATRNVYLDLLLGAGVETAALEARLREEREVRATGGGRTAHYPVSVPLPGVVRVEIQGPTATVAAPEEAVRRLGTWLRVEEAREEVIDLSRAKERPSEETDAGLLALLASGDVVRAAMAVRVIRGVANDVALGSLDELWRRGAGA